MAPGKGVPAGLWLDIYALGTRFSHNRFCGVLRVAFSTEIPQRAGMGLWRKNSSAKQRKRAVFVGSMGLFLGCLFLLELAFGLVHWAK
jgi:hypothetical protein